MSDQCLFCGIVAGTVPSVKVAEDAATFAFMDINPASDGHLLVVPKRHSTDLLDIAADDLTAVTVSAQRIAAAAMRELGATGVNLLNCCGADAWQTVFHFHLHVVPRYVDKAKDRLVLPWTPGTAGDAPGAPAVARHGRPVAGGSTPQLLRRRAVRHRGARRPADRPGPAARGGAGAGQCEDRHLSRREGVLGPRPWHRCHAHGLPIRLR